MAWPDKLKLKKGLVLTLTGLGYNSPKDVQQKTLSRIAGGQDVIVAGPKGCGRTTTYVLAVLNKFNYAAEGVPRVLILVPAKDDVEAVLAIFSRFNDKKSLSIVGLYATPGTEKQMDALAEGADVVVATPDRARAIYLKLGLNLNKIELLILDDADQIVKQGLQLPVVELANSINKCQHLVFTEVIHDKLNKMIAPFMQLPAIVKVEDEPETKLDVLDQVLYMIPNFGSKLNLLNLFMQDDNVFTKVILFVNTKPTAEQIFKSLQSRIKEQVTLYKPWFFDWRGFSSVDEFKTDAAARILIVVNDDDDKPAVSGIPFIIHFELPADKETYIERVINHSLQHSDETIAITFATDIELSAVKKIEQATGVKIPLGDLPGNLIIEKGRSKNDVAEAKQVARAKPADVPGEAFHEKKAANAKTYNYRAGIKAKMNNKRKH